MTGRRRNERELPVGFGDLGNVRSRNRSLDRVNARPASASKFWLGTPPASCRRSLRLIVATTAACKIARGVLANTSLLTPRRLPELWRAGTVLEELSGRQDASSYQRQRVWPSESFMKTFSLVAGNDLHHLRFERRLFFWPSCRPITKRVFDKGRRGNFTVDPSRVRPMAIAQRVDPITGLSWIHNTRAM